MRRTVSLILIVFHYLLQLLHYIGIGILVLWGSFVNVFLAGTVFAPYRAPFIALNQASPWIALLSLLLFAVAVALRGPSRLLVWLSPGVFAFVIWYLPDWLPHHSPKVSGPSIVAVTYNVNMWGTTDSDRILAAIDGLDADVIGLEELPPHLQSRLNAELRRHYPYQVAEAVDRYDGFGLLSRFPIVESQVVMDMDWYPADYRVPGYLRAVLNVDGQLVAVYVVHTPLPVHYIDVYSLDGYMQGIRYALFDYDDQLALAHTTHIAALVAAESIPALVLCDCNSTPHSHQYKILDRVMDETFGQQGWGLGLSHPVKPFPMLRVDYIWYTSEFVAIDAKVWPEAGSSDHYPVWARLALDTSKAY